MATAELARPPRTGASSRTPQRGAERARDARRQPADVVQAVLLALTSFTVLIPLTRVVERGEWSLHAVLLCVVLLGVGQVARWLRAGGAGAVLAETLVAVALFTTLGFPGTGLLGFVPSAQTFTAAGDAVRAAMAQVNDGVAPLAATPALVATLLLAYAAIVIFLDWIVLWARLPLLGGLVIVLLVLLPGAVVPDDNDAWALVLALCGIAAMLFRATAQARRADGVRAPGSSPALVAAGVTALALGAASFIAPALPGGPGTVTTGIGPGPRIDASIDLGRDLRRPREVRLLTYRTTLSSPPYLRMATLTAFDGDVWQPDAGDLAPLNWLASNPDVPDATGGDIAVTEERAVIRTDSLQASLLPIPERASSVEGAQGSWRVATGGRTLASGADDAGGQRYSVSFSSVRPTAEQMHARPSVLGDDAAALAVPADVPPELAELAAQVTAGADNDYDRLVALQNWFRSEFGYSLEAPVEDGFDGTSMRALGTFLEVRKGYCVHFATAFTLMARSLGMPTRIVLGTLPGEATGESIDGHAVWQSTSSDLHTWPEVHFRGVGWIPFEPTATLGTPTAFATAAADAPVTEPTASAPAPTRSIQDEAPVAPSSAPAAAPDQVGPTLQRMVPALVFALVAAGVLLVPFAIRRVLRWRRRAAAARGDAAEAWVEFCSDLADAGVDVPEGDTPRALVAHVGDRLPQTLTAPLLDAIERYSYAERPDTVDGATLVRALQDVHAELSRGVRPDARVALALFPRSLLHPIRRRMPSRHERTG